MRRQPGEGAGEKARTVRADQPRYRSARDPAVRDIAAHEREGQRGPGAKMGSAECTERGSEE